MDASQDEAAAADGSGTRPGPLGRAWNGAVSALHRRPGPRDAPRTGPPDSRERIPPPASFIARLAAATAGAQAPSWAERDRSWARASHRASTHPAVRATLVAMSWLADGIIFYGTILVLPWIGGPRGTACSLRMVLLGVVDLIIYRILKRHFARPRPFIDCPEVVPRARVLDEHSFPSGHMLHSVAFGTLLCAYYPGLAVVVWPFVALVAASRVVLGLHYPSDVLVGAAIGWLMAASVLVLF